MLSAAAATNSEFVVFLEGNIGCGKTDLLDWSRSSTLLSSEWEIVTDPIDV